MDSVKKLIIIKTIHTAVWLFFNVVIMYMFYAAVVGKLDKWLWFGYGLIALEGLILIVFRFFCPLTILARRYSDSDADNFDIYLPNWLARHNKSIYTVIMIIIIIITISRILA